MRLSRTDRSLVARWWFSVDRQLLAAILMLIVAGFMLSLAASPAIAMRRGLGAFFFAKRHAIFLAAGVPVMLAVSMLGAAQLRRICLMLFLTMAGLMVLVLLNGQDINGARRWVQVAGQQLQPSELMKPAFVVLIAWLLAQARLRPDMPAMAIAVAGYLAVATLLVQQPDIGQTLLLTAVVVLLLFLSGQPLLRLGLIGLLAVLAVAVAYQTLPHVHSRIDRFLDPAAGSTYQMDRARQSIIAGGLLGRGPGEGEVKNVLPDAHTDYVLAVIAEEYGALACLLLLALYAFVVFRALSHTWTETDLFRRLVVSGLSLLLCVQTLINAGVNAGLLPAKGMTLPFVSYGGSSIIGMCVTMGLLLAYTRLRPDAPLRRQRPLIGSDTLAVPERQVAA